MLTTYLRAKEIATQQLEQSFQKFDSSIDADSYFQKLIAQLENWGCEEHLVSTSNLPILSCEANGGSHEQAAFLLAAWRLTRLALKIYDDVEDGDINCQQAHAINVAMGLLSTAQLVLQSESTHGDECCRAFNQMLLRAGAGQHCDLAQTHSANIVALPEEWMIIVKAKSGEFFGWASWVGAAIVGGTKEDLSAYQNYGRCLGVLLQIADDFGGVWNPDDNSDLLTGSFSLPVCYGLAVTKGEARTRLIKLLSRARAGEIDAEQDAKQFLIDLGAQVYLLAIAQMEYQQAVTALESIDLSVSSRSKFITLLDETMPGLSLIDESSALCQNGSPITYGISSGHR